MGMRACAFELAEDGFLVGEKVTDQAVVVALVHGEGVVRAWAEDAGGKVVGESGNEGFFCGGEFD